MITQDNLKIYIKEFNTLYKEFGKNARCCDIENEVLSLNNPNLSLRFTKEAQGADIIKHGVIVAKCGNAKQNLEFAQIIGANTKLHRDMIIASKDVKTNILASVKIKDILHAEYMEKHGKVVLEYGNVADVYTYLRYNYKRGLKCEPYFSYIERFGGDRLNMLVAKEIDTADILRHGKVIINNRVPISNYVFAKIPGADVLMHERVIIEGNDECASFLFVRDFKDCNLIAHAKKIINSNNDIIQKDFFKWLAKNYKLSIVDELIGYSNLKHKKGDDLTL